MRANALLAVLMAVPALAAPPRVAVGASFVPPAKAGAKGAIAVTLEPSDPEVHVNQEPAPRLKLDPDQGVLLDKQPPAPSKVPTYDPDTAKYLDPLIPVRFPVAFAPQAPKGTHSVKASVTYFYCSKREGWCRKGTAEVEVPVSVP